MSDLHSLVEEMKERERERHELMQNTPFEECIKLRELGEIIQDSDGLNGAQERLEVEYDLKGKEAEQHFRRYFALFQTNPHLPHRAEIYGSLFFSGTDAEELASEVRYSQGEIKRWIREYVAVHVEEEQHQNIELTDEVPKIDAIFDPQRDAISDVQSSLSDIDLGEVLESVKELENSAFDFKWVDFLVVGFRDELYRVYEEEGEDEAITILSKLLGDEEAFEAILSQVDSRYLQGEREKIVREAIDAHNEGRYALSIPAILSQIDGAIVEAATDLGIWELDNDVTGTLVVARGEGSPQHISEIREPFRDIYPKTMGRGSPRSKILHGIRTDFVDDKSLSTKMIWLALKSFSVADNIYSDIFIREKKALDYLSVSTPKNGDEIANRFLSNEIHALDRCQELAQKGHIEETNSGAYRITTAGQQRLSELRGY